MKKRIMSRLWYSLCVTIAFMFTILGFYSGFALTNHDPNMGVPFLIGLAFGFSLFCALNYCGKVRSVSSEEVSQDV